MIPVSPEGSEMEILDRERTSALKELRDLQERVGQAARLLRDVEGRALGLQMACQEVEEMLVGRKK